MVSRTPLADASMPACQNRRTSQRPQQAIPFVSAPEAWHAERTMRALELLAFGPLSVPQLAAAMQAHPRTVRRLLSRLEHEDYVVSRGRTRRMYEPTMRIVALAGQVVQNAPLARRAQPYVTLLCEQTRATAHLAVPSYQSVLCLVHESRGMAEVRPQLRELIPAHCTAGGKALLAWREHWRESVLTTSLRAYTERTIVDPSELRRMLDASYQQGFAVEDGEYQVRVRAVAAPVCIEGEAVAALTASARDLDIDAAAPRAVALAAQLTENLRDVAA
jgi:DNA-binding IclR family transcriptional regulator